MKTKMKTAHRRADAAVLGAVLIALLICASKLAISQYAGDELAVAQPISVTQSTVELAVVDLAAQQLCLAEAMYYEARGEGVEGQKAIAEVILQRTHDFAFPKTICGVVHEGAKLRKGCQFSFTCDGSLHRPKNAVSWRRIRELADEIMAGVIRLGTLTDRATYFHTTAVQPAWADGFVRTTQIGNHIFYRRDITRGS